MTETVKSPPHPAETAGQTGPAGTTPRRDGHWRREGPAKRDCVIAAARDVFLETGYGAASMDAVAARANVSKATIYAHFDGKRALFEQVIRDRCQRIFGDDMFPPGLDGAKDAATVLKALACAILDIIMAPEAIAIHRVVIAEAARLPEVGESFHAAGPGPALVRTTAILRELTRRGLLRVPDDKAPVVAELFLSMLKGHAHLRAVLGLSPEGAGRNDLVGVAIDLILSRFGPAPGDPGGH